MVTINEVAELAKVSKATVSRVLNNRPVSPKTYAKVQASIKQLNYQPNAQARGLSLKRTKVVGIILPDIQGPYYSPLIAGIEEVLRKNNYSLIVSRFQEQEYPLAQMLKERKADGLIIVSPRHIGEKSVLALKNDHFSVVVMDGNVGPRVSSVEVDSYSGAFEATEYLINLGHRRIGVITGPNQFKEVQDRLKGYQKALEQQNIPFESRLIREGDYLLGSGIREMNVFLKMDARPTAIFAFNDFMAAGAIQSIFKAGLTVPGDISVVGFDDSFLSEITHPQLTSVRQPLVDMGTIAAWRMLEMLADEERDVSHTKLETQLVIRESCDSPSIHTSYF